MATKAPQDHIAPDFTFTGNDGTAYTLPLFHTKLKGKHLRKMLNAADPERAAQQVTDAVLAAVADEATLAAFEDLDMHEAAQVLADWQAYGKPGVSLGE